MTPWGGVGVNREGYRFFIIKNPRLLNVWCYLTFFYFDNDRAFNGLRQKHRTPNPKSPTDVCRRFSASKRRLSTSDNDVDLRSPSRSGSSRCQVRIVSSGDPLTMMQIFRLILVTCQAKDSMVIGKTTFEISPTNYTLV